MSMYIKIICHYYYLIEQYMLTGQIRALNKKFSGGPPTNIHLFFALGGNNLHAYVDEHLRASS